MEKDAGSRFIRDNFNPEDRLAVVLIDRGSGSVTQRIASARQIASLEFQGWLESENRSGRDVFVSMNALQEQARGRTRADVAVIRHLYLDFDENGTRAVEQLRARDDMPEPNYLVNTSPDHWQVSWKVQGFGKEQAEETMRAMVREFGADPAATDSARVLRIPGLINHKRHPGHMVRMEQLSSMICNPEHFPPLAHEDRRSASPQNHFSTPGSAHRSRLSQSELDWAFAKRALARGESPESVAASIADYRRSDKADPEYYARLTVRKAALDLSGARVLQEPDGPNR
jgi:hypothetical protein